LSHELHVCGEVREMKKIGGGDHLAQFLRDDPRVVGTKPKGDQGSHVPEDRVADGFVELGEVLVREDEAHPVLPKFGELLANFPPGRVPRG